MTAPKVSFIVPCYKLAHLLGECVGSILAQTHQNVEVLIMDDCSPDNTAEVAASFADPRVRHIRNEPNLGHLRNYNKGIGLATGDYIWLISADDRLRSRHVVERYLEVMEANPKVGYAFCPGVGLSGDRETEIIKWGTLDSPDAILNGRQFLRRLLQSNCVLAPSGLVRRDCYHRLGGFPLDLPYAGDWYLWCVFALHYDVAYFAEPMVNYREHTQSMTGTFISDNIGQLARDDFGVVWRMKERIEQAGDQTLAEHCRQIIVQNCIRSLSSKNWRGAKFRMSLDEFERSLDAHARDAHEREDIRRQVLAGIGKLLYWDKDLETDLRLYQLAIKYGAFNPRLWLKYGILRLGAVGTLIMRIVSSLRAAGTVEARRI